MFPICSSIRSDWRRKPKTFDVGATRSARGLLSAEVPNSSFAEAHRVLLPEPTHMEDEDEDQESEKEDKRDGEVCKVHSQKEIRTNTAHEAWMT